MANSNMVRSQGSSFWSIGIVAFAQRTLLPYQEKHSIECYVYFITNDLLKWTMSSTHHWITTIVDQSIKQGLSNDQIMNWITPIFIIGDKNKVSNYRTIMVSSTIAKLYNTIMEQKISAWAESRTKQYLGKWVQTITLHCKSFGCIRVIT